MKAAKSMVRMYNASKEVQKTERLQEKEKEKEGNEGKEPTPPKPPASKDMATFMEGAWYVSVVDVESTLRHVCRKLLTDGGVDKETRRKRAEGLKLLGRVIESAQSLETQANGSKTLRQQMEALVGSMAPPEAAESDDDDAAATAAAVAAAATGAASGADASAVLSREELTKLTIKELKALMKGRELSLDGCLEKSDFIDRLAAAMGEGGVPASETP